MAKLAHKVAAKGALAERRNKKCKKKKEKRNSTNRHAEMRGVVANVSVLACSSNITR